MTGLTAKLHGFADLVALVAADGGAEQKYATAKRKEPKLPSVGLKSKIE
jgi:hypothetical protein